VKEEALNLTGLHSFLSLTIDCVSFLLAINCERKDETRDALLDSFDAELHFLSL